MDHRARLGPARRLQVEFSKTVQSVTEDSATVFSATYLPEDAGIRLLSSEMSTGDDRTTVVAQLIVDGQHATVEVKGNGPIDAMVAGLAELGVTVEVTDYSEHALTAGSGASAVAYVEVEVAGGRKLWGVGMDSSILDASLSAVISAANRVRQESAP